MPVRVCPTYPVLGRGDPGFLDRRGIVMWLIMPHILDGVNIHFIFGLDVVPKSRPVDRFEFELFDADTPREDLNRRVPIH